MLVEVYCPTQWVDLFLTTLQVPEDAQLLLYLPSFSPVGSMAKILIPADIFVRLKSGGHIQYN